MRTFIWIVAGVVTALLADSSCPLRAQAASTQAVGARAVGAQALPGERQPGQTATKPAPPTPIAVKKSELGDDDTWNPAWDKIVEDALPADLLSSRRQRQVKALCPRFGRMSETDRRAFWAYFFQALAGAEAGLRATADVRHAEPEVAVMDPVTHRIARQEGLLQLGYLDSRRYGCDFNWDQDKELAEHDPRKTILQPANNLECGISILENQLVMQHKPLIAVSSYWETLRPGTPGFATFAKQLANLPAACGPSPYRRSSTPNSESASEAKAPSEDAGATATGPAAR